MYRVLIASADEMLTQKLKHHLQGDFFVETCGSGKWALELVNTFSPDIVVLDNKIIELDCLAVIQAIRASGKLIHIIVVTNILSPYLEKRFVGLGVDVAVLKPCKLNVLIAHVQSISQMIDGCGCCDWDVEQMLDNLLLELSFNVGLDKYRQVKEAILQRYNDPAMLMKTVYLEIVGKYGANRQSVEKAVRDAIKTAYNNGDKELWHLLFTSRKNEKHPWPSNDEFVSRIVLFLQQRSRMKPAYKDFPAKIV